MRIAQQLRDEPGGNPVPNLGVRVRRKRDGATLALVSTDSTGVALIQADGNYAPFYLEATNQVGGPRLWSSDDHLAAGAFAPAEAPHALRAMGDGYVPGLWGELAVSLSDTTVTLATGAALAAGYPIVNYTPDTFTLARPAAGTRVDRLVARVYGEAHVDVGLAEFAVLTGSVGSGTPALTQSATLYEVALATVSVPSSGGLTLTDERTPIPAARFRPAPLAGTARAGSVSTGNLSGEALSGLSVQLTLPQSVTYDLEADLSAVQISASSAAFPFEYAYGGYGTGVGQFRVPAGVAVSPDGTKLYVADFVNGRLVVLGYAGGTLSWVLYNAAMGQVSGVCVDASGNVYTVSRSGGGGQLAKWNADATTLLAGVDTGPSAYYAWGICTDNTSVYITNPGDGTLTRRACSNLGSAVSQGGWGQIRGAAYLGGNLYLSQDPGGAIYRGSPSTLQTTATIASGLSQPYGLTTDGTDLYVCESGADRVRKVTTAGAVVGEFGVSGSAPGQLSLPRGVAVDSSGDLWVADEGNNRVQRFGGGTVLGGYGALALDIGGDLSPYVGRGASNGAIANAHTRAVTGPATVSVTAMGKATADTMVLSGAVLSARAVARY